jgi:hypothetical protein
MVGVPLDAGVSKLRAYLYMEEMEMEMERGVGGS